MRYMIIELYIQTLRGPYIYQVVVKTLCGGQVLEVLSNSEMPLAQVGCGVAGRLYQLC